MRSYTFSGPSSSIMPLPVTHHPASAWVSVLREWLVGDFRHRPPLLAEGRLYREDGSSEMLSKGRELSVLKLPTQLCF